MKQCLLIVFTLLVFATSLYAEKKDVQEEGLLNLDFSAAKTIIEAQKLMLFAKKREFQYSGEVDVEHGDLTLTCKNLKGSYTEKNEIDTLIATNDVYIEKGTDIKASGDRAVFDSSKQTLTLTENPQLQQEGSLLSADEVIIYLKEDRSEAVGNVRVTIVENTEPGQANKPKPNATTDSVLGR